MRWFFLVLFLAACGGEGTSALPSPSGSARFVAVGANGVILVSSEGVEWSRVASDTMRSLWTVAAGDQGLVAAGESGTIVRSRDGLTWSAVVSGTETSLGHVVWNGSEYFAAGGDWSEGAVLLKSKDSLSWERIPASEWHMFHALAFLDRRLIAAAYTRSDLQIPALFSTTFSESSAAGSWTQHEGPDFYDSLTHEGKIWVAGGRNVASSNDGLTWQEQTISARSISHSGDSFFVVGESALHISADGETWSSEDAPTDRPLVTGAAAGDTFVAAGSAGTILVRENGVWRRTDSGTMDDIFDVVWF